MPTLPYQPAVTLYFDFVDPLSFLMDREVSEAETSSGIRVRRIGIEINPPPLPLAEPGDPLWAERWDRAAVLADGLDLALDRPSIVPWSRKAHELLWHAEERGVADEIRSAVFHAFFLEHLDIGRVDVLVSLAGRAGLDVTETKAVLDVDRFSAGVSDRRDEVVASGVDAVPSLVAGARSLQGFHNRASLGTFLRGSP
jgi:predicted DsbA family dithiol-disulfide isomerase